MRPECDHMSAAQGPPRFAPWSADDPAICNVRRGRASPSSTSLPRRPARRFHIRIANVRFQRCLRYGA